MITAKGTAKLLLDNLYKRFGLLDKIISDQGPQFTLKAFVELLKLLGIRLVLSTAYHLQTDGTTECINQEIKAYLGIYCASHPEEWVTALSTLEFTHNNQSLLGDLLSLTPRRVGNCTLHPGVYP